LKAYHRGGNIVIEIADDGKGLDKQKIINKAIKSGVLQGDENLSDRGNFQAYFYAGFIHG